MRAVVTGSGGFIGRSLVAQLGGATALRLGAPDWREAIGGADFRGAVVFHLAARVHQRGSDEADWLRDNVEKTDALARAAARGGATRFVFASTIKVHGEETGARAFTASDAPNPSDAYARSKRLAEEKLSEAARDTGLSVVIVRPPLVFGAGAKANLRGALRLARTSWPLPFAGIRNRRSWIHVEDLCALLIACARHPAAPGRTFIACHPRPFSTPELIGGLRERLGRPRNLFSVPARWLEGAGFLLGQGERVRRLTRSLEGDSAETREALDWEPRDTFAMALDDLVRDGASP